MLLSSQLIKDSRFPKQITNHPVFSKYKKFKKIFPEIGLENCSTNIKQDHLTSNDPTLKAAAANLRSLMYENFINRYYGLCNYRRFIRTESRRVKLEFLLKLLDKLMFELRTYSCIQENENGKCKLVLIHDIQSLENKPFFRAGESLFKVYTKLNELLVAGKFQQLQDINQTGPCKTFNNLNMPIKNMQLVFSSDGLDGAWDLATMSMRGIVSCQRWDNIRSRQLVGSIVDPFTGIIYLTTGAKFDFGTRMVRRCIVRFAARKPSHSPLLILERMYPSYDAATAKLFIDFLQNKTQNKFEIVQQCNDDEFIQENCIVPLTPKVQFLTPNFHPYVDSKAQFFSIHKTKSKNKTAVDTVCSKDQLREELAVILQKLNAKLFNGLKKFNYTKFAYETTSCEIVRSLRSKKNWDRFVQHQNELANSILDNVLNPIAEEITTTQFLQTKIDFLKKLYSGNNCWEHYSNISTLTFIQINISNNINLHSVRIIYDLILYRRNYSSLLNKELSSSKKEFNLIEPSFDLSPFLDKVK